MLTGPYSVFAASQESTSELNPRGRLHRCLRFSPTGCPAKARLAFWIRAENGVPYSGNAVMTEYFERGR